jgi:hypothetical protein
MKLIKTTLMAVMSVAALSLTVPTFTNVASAKCGGSQCEKCHSKSKEVTQKKCNCRGDQTTEKNIENKAS